MNSEHPHLLDKKKCLQWQGSAYSTLHVMDGRHQQNSLSTATNAAIWCFTSNLKFICFNMLVPAFNMKCTICMQAGPSSFACFNWILIKCQELRFLSRAGILCKGSGTSTCEYVTQINIDDDKKKLVFLFKCALSILMFVSLSLIFNLFYVRMRVPFVSFVCILKT